MKKVSIITPTGGRPEAFGLCELWYRQQSIHNLVNKYKLEWLVVDDCSSKATRFKLNQVFVPAPMQWTPEINTQRGNMHELLKKVTGDYLFVWEDDEYYSPTYIEDMLKLLETNDIVGLSNSKYYHVQIPGFKYMNNYSHSSLCHTAMTKSVIPLLYKAVHSGKYYFDIELWKYAVKDKLRSALLANSNLSIGIKGMPGRLGLGAGHERVGYHGDDDHTMFKHWVGKDWEHYKAYLK